MTRLAIVSVPAERHCDLEPLWRALYEHHIALTPHLRDRVVPFEVAWATRHKIDREWLQSEPQSFVLAAEDADRYVGYAFLRVRSGVGIAAAWNASDPLAELATLAVLPEFRGRGVGSAIMDAAEERLRALGINDMTIDVITANVEAVPFYERRGAVPFITKFIHHVQPGPRVIPSPDS
jgi:GNAT superfamily N-acetyltransferase